MGSAKKKKRPAVAADKPSPVHQHQSVTSSTNKTNYFLAFLLILATALLYGHSLWNPLVFDDLQFFVDSNLERLGSSLFQLDLRWFSYVTFGWTYNLVGLDWFWYRLGNLVLHALTSVLLFVFFSRLLDLTVQPQGAGIQPRWLAFFGALIFALHPVAVYGAAYLVQRSIIMATLFGIASLLCYMEGLTRDRARWFVLSALFYFLAVFSKEHSIMLPGAAAALTLLLRKPSFSLIKKVWLPFSLYIVIGVLIILRSKGLLGTAYESVAKAMLSQLSEPQHKINIEHAYGLSVITEGALFFKYLFLWIAPLTSWMAVDIRQPFATHLLSWPESAGLLLFIAYPLMALRLLLKGGRIGLLGFGLLFPWILYLTELSSVRIQEPFVLYRSYLWMSGLPIVLLAIPARVPKKILAIGLSTFCLVLAALAWNRLDTFSNDLKLWTDAIETNQNDKLLGMERIYNNRGAAYMHLGQAQKAKEDFIKAFTLNPGYDSPYFNLGAANLYLNDFEAALQYYNAGIKLRPDFAVARIFRSTLFLQMGRNAEALKDCEYALYLGSTQPDAYLNCSAAHSRMGNTQEALRYLDDGLRINPRMVEAYISRSLINARRGLLDAALDDLEQALRTDPKNASVYYNRGVIHSAMGRFQDAMKDFNMAIDLDQGYVDAYVNRGGLYMLDNQLPQAILDYAHAIRLNPNQEDVYINLGNIYMMQSRYQDALANFDQALKLNPNNVQTQRSRADALMALNKQNKAMTAKQQGEK